MNWAPLWIFIPILNPALKIEGLYIPLLMTDLDLFLGIVPIRLFEFSGKFPVGGANKKLFEPESYQIP